MVALLPWIALGTQVIGGISQANAADRAAQAAQEVGEFNAKLIERDIGLLERQRDIINSNFITQTQRAKTAFERDIQGAVRSGFGYAGIDMSQGSPIEIMRQNAREFQYELDVAEFNNEVTNMQISDQQESARLNAEMSRMEGGAQAAGLRAQGTASMISAIGGAANTAYEYKLFGK